MVFIFFRFQWFSNTALTPWMGNIPHSSAVKISYFQKNEGFESPFDCPCSHTRIDSLFFLCLSRKQPQLRLGEHLVQDLSLSIHPIHLETIISRS